MTQPRNRQIVNKADVRQLGEGPNTSNDVLINAIDIEVTPPFALRESATPNMILNIGPANMVNPSTGKNRVPQPVNGTPSTFPGSTIAFPVASGGTIVNSAGANTTLNIAPGMFKKILISVDNFNVIYMTFGIDHATLALANAESLATVNFAIGYVVVRNVGGVIQSITESYISQYIGDGSGVSASYVNSTATKMAIVFG